MRYYLYVFNIFLQFYKFYYSYVPTICSGVGVHLNVYAIFNITYIVLYFAIKKKK